MSSILKGFYNLCCIDNIIFVKFLYFLINLYGKMSVKYKVIKVFFIWCEFNGIEVLSVLVYDFLFEFFKICVVVIKLMIVLIKIDNSNL